MMLGHARCWNRPCSSRLTHKSTVYRAIPCSDERLHFFNLHHSSRASISSLLSATTPVVLRSAYLVAGASLRSRGRRETYRDNQKSSTTTETSLEQLLVVPGLCDPINICRPALLHHHSSNATTSAHASIRAASYSPWMTPRNLPSSALASIRRSRSLRSPDLIDVPARP
jgi:hypothetical protein